MTVTWVVLMVFSLVHLVFLYVVSSWFLLTSYIYILLSYVVLTEMVNVQYLGPTIPRITPTNVQNEKSMNYKLYVITRTMAAHGVIVFVHIR